MNGTEVHFFHEAYYICLSSLACPWKCISYLPTCMAILQTSHEKGSFQIRSSVLFLNCHILQRATVPGWYLVGFFTWPAHKNSFWGALPPMVGLSFLCAGSSLPDLDGLASAAIWTNCQVGNDDGDCPTPLTALPPPPTSLLPLSWVRPPWLKIGGELERGASFLSLPVSFILFWILTLFSCHPSPPSLGLVLFWSF